MYLPVARTSLSSRSGIAVSCSLCPTPLPGAHAAVEHDQIPRELLQLAAEVFEMVLPLGEEDRRAALVECLDDIVEDEPVTLFVCH